MPDPISSPAEEEASAAALALAPDSLLRRYQGPGVLLSAAGDIHHETSGAKGLTAMLVNGPGRLSDLGRELFDVTAGGTAIVRRVVTSVPGQTHGAEALDLTVLPVLDDASSNAQLLILARDASLDRNLIEALVNSRALFKDLADCSGDFIWEVDRTERFSFVSAGGAVGYLPHALNGASPAGLALDPHEAEHMVAFFASREPVSDHEIWLRSEKGEAACLIASVRPLFDEAGRWAGARGVARDVTLERRRERELNEQREDDALISAIARAMQQELSPDDMLQAAARVMGHAFHAAAAWIVPLRADGGQAAPPAFHIAPLVGIDMKAPDFTALMETAEPSEADGSAYRIWREGAYLCLLTHHWDVVNGLVVLLDATGRAEAMLAHAADHLANAIEQARQLRELDRLSRTDELTGLKNRRAFLSGLRDELAANRNEKTPAGTLMLVDMDNFKAVNDTHGHPAGDRLLVSLAEQMTSLIAVFPQASNMAARLGGDEFGVWVSGADGSMAALMAEQLVRSFEKTAEAYDGDARPGLSVGMAVAMPGETVPDLMSRADRTLYEVKRAGKGTWKLSAAPENALQERGVA